MNAMKTVITPIHPAGHIFIGAFALATFILWSFSDTLGALGLIATAWCVYFFRNPNRVSPESPRLVVSPADGRVCNVTHAKAPKEIGEDTEYLRISIFLNVFDVHVNRIPIAGKIIELIYHAGQFINASMDKASEKNERQTIVMETQQKEKIIFVQIAGLVARRILCDLEDEQEVKTGEVFGIIRFGSRMDVYLPKKTKPLVIVGQRAVAGETLLADLDNRLPEVKSGS